MSCPSWTSAQTHKRQHHQDPAGLQVWNEGSRGTRTCWLGIGRRNSGEPLSQQVSLSVRITSSGRDEVARSWKAL